jgi:hypothetical protein
MAMSHSRCIPPHERIDQVMNEVNNIVITGATYTAGDGIDAAQLALNIIQTSIDGVSIIFDAGVMKAVAASDLVAGCGITIAAGEVSAATDGTTIDCIGGNLSVIAYAFGKIVVAGQTDVDADQVVDTLTLVAGANMAITTSGDTITLASSYVDTNTTYTAGAGINLSGTKFIADPNTASHVGLVDPTSGDDSSADDAQIGVLWHSIAAYDVDENMLVGHASGDSTKPVVTYKTVADWLKTLPDYSDSTPLLLLSDGGADGNEIRWATIAEALSLLTGYTLGNEQSIGKDAGTGPEWQDDTDACP